MDIKKQIIKLALLCSITFFDENSKISPALANRVHVVFEEIFVILQQVLPGNLKQSIVYVLKNPNDIDYYNDILMRLVIKIKNEELNEINLRLKYLAEFGRLLPYQGNKYCYISDTDIIEDDVFINRIIENLKMSKYKKSMENASIAIVLCFRIENKKRLRNFYAALISIYYQDFGRENIKIIAVNQDGEDKYMSSIEKYVDKYIFAKNHGDYNYSWARNIGAQHAVKAKYIVFWDVDIVAPNDIVRKIFNAFNDHKNIGCVIPYTSSCNLDEKSTSYLLTQLLNTINLDRVLERISAQIMHEVYGMVISVESNLFFEIGGQDERYEGWGDEDNDFYYRIYDRCNVKRLNSLILHLNHPRPIMRIGKDKINKKCIGTKKNCNEEIGDLNKYS